MYNIYAKIQKPLAAIAAASCLLFAGNVSADKPAKASPGKPGDQSIVALALATPDFSSLVDAILCFGPPENNPIIDLLSGSDKYTVFAPNNAAFAALLGDTDPCDVPPVALFEILAYHVTDGRHFANSVFNFKNPKMIEMLSGGYITSLPSLQLLDVSGATVDLGSLINVNASNGVIHEVQSVLIPFPPAP